MHVILLGINIKIYVRKYLLSLKIYNSFKFFTLIFKKSLYTNTNMYMTF